MTGFAALTRALPLTLLVLLDACGGGSGGGGGGPPPTYAVGGSISGLSSAGLVLANGSDTVSPASGATTFTFAVPVASGAAYAVSVQTQPANAACTVTGGAGTVAGGAVTSVQVNCSPTTFQVGGTISGLTAAGLVLANGSDSVSPAANATAFVFGTRVTSGTGYTVSVSQQPTGLTCSVANGSGTATANIANVAVSCAAVPVAHWSTPSVVGKGVHPQLASDPSGVAFFLAWCSCTGAGGATDATSPTVASRYTDAGGWAAPATIAMTDGGILAGIGFDSQGKGFALWAEVNGNNDGTVSAFYSRYTPATGWSYARMPFAVTPPPVVVPSGSLLYSSLPPLGLSVGSDGSAVALVFENAHISTSGNYTRFDLAALEGGAGAGSDILQIGLADPSYPPSDPFPSTYTDANGNPVPYFPQQTWFPFDPVTASALPGHYAALYRTIDLVPATLQGVQTLDSVTTTGLNMHNGFGTSATIPLYTEDNLAENPIARGVYRLGVSKESTAIAANGDALVAWSVIADDLASVTVYAARFIGGSWLAPQVVYTNAGDYSAYKLLPVTALDGAGNGMIVFNAPGTLMAVKMDAVNGVLSTPTPVATDGGLPVSLKMDTRGNAFLLVLGSVRRYDTGTDTWSAPTAAGGDPNEVMGLALDNDGNAMVAWSYGGSILAIRYR